MSPNYPCLSPRVQSRVTNSPLLGEQVSDLAKELATLIDDLEKFTGAEGDASHFYPDPEIRLPPYTPSEMMSIDEIPIIADLSPYCIENSRDDSEAKTLVRATFDEDSADRLRQWMKNNNIPQSCSEVQDARHLRFIPLSQVRLHVVKRLI